MQTEPDGAAGKRHDPIVMAICGASGSIYGVRMLHALSRWPMPVRLSVSSAGRQVMAHELGAPSKGDLLAWLGGQGVDTSRLVMDAAKDLFAPPASGSFRHAGMVVVPCSMKTMGAIAAGLSENLIQRAADVTMKERRPLILMTRETPLSPIHIENMHRLALAGATIMPLSPGFYFHPASIEALVDAMVARALDHLGLESDQTARWGETVTQPFTAT